MTNMTCGRGAPINDVTQKSDALKTHRGMKASKVSRRLLAAFICIPNTLNYFTIENDFTIEKYYRSGISSL
jgi:hypothetical protein